MQVEELGNTACTVIENLRIKSEGEVYAQIVENALHDLCTSGNGHRCC